MGSNRSVPREVSPRTVITVLRVKRTSQASNREIARRLGIGRSTVDRIVRGKHVSLRDGGTPTLRRCGCGAAVTLNCVRCAAVEFRRQVEDLMNAFQLLHAGIQSPLMSRLLKSLKIPPELTRLIQASAESMAVATWLSSQRGVEDLRQAIRDLPEEVAIELERHAVPIAKLSGLVCKLLGVVEYVSGETEPAGGQTGER